MATRAAVLLGALVLVLLGGLGWFALSSDPATPEGLSAGPSVQQGVRPGATDARLEPVADAQRPGEARGAVPLDGVEPEARPEARVERSRAEVVKLIVRAADGGPILEALASWGLSGHPLTCVGTRESLDRHSYGTISSSESPFRFATLQPTLVDRDQVFNVVVRERPCHLSLLFSGVVVATERVEEDTSEVIVQLSEGEARAALGSTRFCLIGLSGETPRARAYLRGSTTNQLHAEPGDGGCLEFRDVSPGEYQLSIYANRHASRFSTVRIEPSQVRDLGDITLESPVPLVGVLTGEARHLSNRQVSIQTLDRSGSELRTFELRQVSTDSQGTFRVFDLAGGEYVLQVVAPTVRGGSGVADWPLSRPLIVNSRMGAQMQVELPLEPAQSLVLRSVHARAVDVELRDEQDIPVLRTSLGARGVLNVGILPGRYQVIARSDGQELERSMLQTPPTLTTVIGD